MNSSILFCLQLLFWLSVALVAYTYAGYPLLLFLASSAADLWRSWRRLLHGEPDGGAVAPPWPGVSIVVAAHNEEAELPALVASLRALDYPRDRLQLVLVSDGSSDGTNDYLASLCEPWIEIVLLPRQQGKANALNHGVARARHALLLFTDASTRHLPDTLGKLVRHFDDPDVGVVCGALRFQHHDGSRNTEGAYWSYECLLRLMEGRLGATLTASGALYALRKQCFPGLSASAWIEDFLVPMHARRVGYRVLYDPEALAWEVPAPSVRGEFTRRVRLAIGSFRALRSLLGTRLDRVTQWAFVSHKLLRWCVPFLLLLALLANAALWPLPPYRWLLLLQLAVYGLAASAACAFGPARRSRLAQGLSFFVAMNAAFLWGFLLFLFDRGDTAWQQVR